MHVYLRNYKNIGGIPSFEMEDEHILRVQIEFQF